MVNTVELMFVGAIYTVDSNNNISITTSGHISNTSALTANLIQGIILKASTATSFDSEGNPVNLVNKYYNISLDGSLTVYTPPNGVVEQNGMLGGRSVYGFNMLVSTTIVVQPQDVYWIPGYLFATTIGAGNNVNGQTTHVAYVYKQLVSPGQMPGAYIYYPNDTSVIDEQTVNLTCIVSVDSSVDGNTITKSYTWNDGYTYKLKTVYNASTKKFALDYMANDSVSWASVGSYDYDPFLNLILVNNSNGILNVDLTYVDFTNIIIKRVTNPGEGETVAYFSVDSAGQEHELTSSEVEALQIQNGVTVDGRQVVQYDQFTTQVGEMALVINFAQYITQSVNVPDDQVCDEISVLIEDINNYGFEHIGKLSDYTGLIDSINEYSNTLSNNQVNLSMEQVSVLENYANYIGQMTGIFGQMILSLETTSIVDASALELRIKNALKLILDGLKKIQAFKVSITDTTILGIPVCITNMAAQLNKLTYVDESDPSKNGGLIKLENMLDYFLSGNDDYESEFGLSEEDKAKITAAEAMVANYTANLQNEINDVMTNPAIISLENSFNSFAARQTALINFNNQLMYALGSAGIKVHTVVSQAPANTRNAAKKVNKSR